MNAGGTAEREGHWGYDVIGDVHGCYGHLVALLRRLGYEDELGAFRHRRRTVIFVGDLMDRGPEQLQVLRLVKAMVDHGSAQVVMGNHEFNAMAFATEHPAEPGRFLRPRTDKNLKQHLEFLRQVGVGSSDHRDLMAWFATLPLWLECDGLRVVHACWDETAMEGLGGDPLVSPDLLVHASDAERPEFHFVEHLCKGPEIRLPDGIAFTDKDGHVRHHARFRWWDPSATTYPTACEGPPSGVLPDRSVEEPPVATYDGDVPVLFGHYWRRWPDFRLDTVDMAARAACIDFSAVAGGPLVAYRWSGEDALDRVNLVAGWPAHR